MILQMSRESEMILIDLFECKSYSDVKETLLLKIYISIQLSVDEFFNKFVIINIKGDIAFVWAVVHNCES